MVENQNERLIHSFEGFLAKVKSELQNPQADLSELYFDFIRTMGLLPADFIEPQAWENHLSSCLEKDSHAGYPKTFLNSDVYQEAVVSFLERIIHDLRELPLPLELNETVPSHIAEIVEAYDAKKLKEQKLVEQYWQQVRDILKAPNQINHAELKTKFSNLKQPELEMLVQTISEEILRDRIEAVVNSRQPTKVDDSGLAQKVIARQKALLSGITLAGEKFSPPPELVTSAEQILKIPQKQLIEAVISSATVIDARVSPEEMIKLPLPEAIQPISVVSDHLIREVRFIAQAPITDSTPKGHQEIIQARLTQTQLTAIVPVVVNILRFDPEFIHGNPQELVPKLVVSLQKLIKPPNGKQLSQEAILSILSFVYSPPSSPEKGKLLGWALQSATFTNLPPIIPENQDFKTWLKNNREALTKHVDFWHRYFESPAAPKKQIVPNKNVLNKDFRQQYELILGGSGMVEERGPLLFRIFRGFRNILIRFIPSISSGTQVGLNRFLTGVMRLPGGLRSLSLAQRLAGFESTVSSVAKSVFSKYKIVFYVLIGLLIFMFTSGVVMPGTPLGKAGYVRTALLPPGEPVFVPEGAVPWVPPGGGGGGYIDPAGCDLQYSDPVLGCCVPNAGFCSMSYLKPYFGQYGTEELVAASKICFKESVGGLAGVVNDSCFPCKPVNGVCTSGRAVLWPVQTLDYSVGLFQINLLADSDCGIEPLPEFAGPDGPSLCYTKIASDPLMQTGCCRIKDDPAAIVKLDACYKKYSNPVENIQRALSKLRFDQNGDIIWYPTWGAARTCGYDDNRP